MLHGHEIAGHVDEIIRAAAGTVGARPVEGMLSGEMILNTDFGFDSLDVVELISALETRFDVTIPDEVLARKVTVDELRTLISKLLHENEPR